MAGRKLVATRNAGEMFGEIVSNAVSQRRTATCIAKESVTLKVLSTAKELRDVDQMTLRPRRKDYVETDTSRGEHEARRNHIELVEIQQAHLARHEVVAWHYKMETNKH